MGGATITVSIEHSMQTPEAAHSVGADKVGQRYFLQKGDLNIKPRDRMGRDLRGVYFEQPGNDAGLTQE